ncbi:MAG: peptide deformylase, partial [Geminicoccaceae bacterium]
MAILDIILAPDTRLTTPCQPVDAVDLSLTRLMDDMLETMYAAPGIGLAAPQVGVLKRFFVVAVGEDDARDPRFFVNPEITRRSET